MPDTLEQSRCITLSLLTGLAYQIAQEIQADSAYVIGGSGRRLKKSNPAAMSPDHDVDMVFVIPLVGMMTAGTLGSRIDQFTQSIRQYSQALGIPLGIHGAELDMHAVYLCDGQPLAGFDAIVLDSIQRDGFMIYPCLGPVGSLQLFSTAIVVL